MVIGTALGLGTGSTIALAVVLAFIFGYLLTMMPLLRAGIGYRSALGLAFAADTASITIMEIVDNTVMLAIPGAMDAGLTDFSILGKSRPVARHCWSSSVSGSSLANCPGPWPRGRTKYH